MWGIIAPQQCRSHNVLSYCLPKYLWGIGIINPTLPPRFLAVDWIGSGELQMHSQKPPRHSQKDAGVVWLATSSNEYFVSRYLSTRQILWRHARARDFLRYKETVYELPL
ncbi:hypothetical protein TNCV_4752631 [Trichonephila clavipes]|nr:hypothetical protein TNCV_4752631 [Trichonephila clavipes]